MTFASYYEVRDASGRLRYATVYRSQADQFARRVQSEDRTTCRVETVRKEATR